MQVTPPVISMVQVEATVSRRACFTTDDFHRPNTACVGIPCARLPAMIILLIILILLIGGGGYYAGPGWGYYGGGGLDLILILLLLYLIFGRRRTL